MMELGNTGQAGQLLEVELDGGEKMVSSHFKVPFELSWATTRGITSQSATKTLGVVKEKCARESECVRTSVRVWVCEKASEFRASSDKKSKKITARAEIVL